jgi:signal transduction histidine kinase/ActR/RegA family two-component response regulator
MKTKKRLQLILVVCVLLFCLSAYIVEKIISNKISLLLDKRLEHVTTEADKLLVLQNNSIKSYVVENSYWDELCSAVKKRDTSWISSNMATPLKTPLYQANFLWISDSLGNNIYNQTFNAAQPNSTVRKPSPAFLKSFNHKLTEKFCFKNGAVYFEGYVASIVPGSDYERKTKPVGFLLVGRILDKNYLANLHNLNTDFDYSFEPEGAAIPKDFINKVTATLTCYKTITCLNGPPAVIKITNSLPEIKTYTGFVLIVLIGYFVFVALVIIVLYRYFFKYFFRPLEKITIALQKNNALPLANIIKKDTELGNVAKLIATFFKQNKELKIEIDSRIKSELELKLALDKIQKSTVDKIRAEQSAEAKSEFLSTMSHEIRTPINGVIGIANLLKDEELTPRQREYVDILNFSSKHLLSLVSDILDFSKIENGKVEFDHTSFNLNNVCNNVYQVFKISADEKNIGLIYKPDEALQNSIYGDSVRINQVLTNLVGNAIKFTNSGQVSFGYKLLSKTTNNCTIEFTVKDTGIGIADDEQDKIFDGFSQANKTISSEYGGSGLGLPISKKLIELQGGKLQMSSEFGKGTTFTFYLTFETHAYEGVLPAPPKASFIKKDVLNGMKVLIAEDNKINILVIKRFLEKWGIHYRVSVNGKEALQMIDKEDFDLVLMDLHMPEMDGEDATKLIRINPSKKISSLPIIALTANASIDTQQKLLNNGFTNYISKPFNPDNLFKLLKKYYYAN